MARFALVNNGVVYNTFEADDLSQAQAVFPDCVPLMPGAGIGSTFDGSNFGPPTNNSPRLLKRYDFFSRFTRAERIAIRGSADANVIDFLDITRLMETVNLDDAFIVQAVNYAESHNLIAAGRAAQILA